MTATKKPPKTNKKLKFANVSGRKKIMLITVFAAVVVGAGVIIRSFAATNSWVYNIDNNHLSVADDVRGNCVHTNIKESAKNGSTIINVACKNDGVVEIGTIGAAAGANLSYRACATAKGTGRISVSIGGEGIPEPNPNASPHAFQNYNVTSSGYNYYCTPSATSTKFGSLHGHISIYDKGSFINVASITIEQLNSSSTPPPAAK